MSPVRLDETNWDAVSVSIAPPKGKFVAEVADTARWSRRTVGQNNLIRYTLSIPSSIVGTLQGDDVKEGRRVTARIEYPDTEKGRAMGETLIKRVAMALGVTPDVLFPTTVTDDEDPYNGGLIEGLEGIRYQLTIGESDASYDSRLTGERVNRTETRFFFDPIRS